MELTWYLYPGWNPRIRPASPRREWMDAAPESFAYRCLPLAIANAHGWEVLSPCGFRAIWDGAGAAEGVRIELDSGAPTEAAPVALFGQGVLTFHIAGLIRTSPGWNLWLGGSPNAAKDGIAALGGVIETDWSPYSFTMNWRFTRPHHWVRFEEDEPIAFFMPIQRHLLEAVEPKFVAIDDNPELKAQFEAWSYSRDAFQQRMREQPSSTPSEKWQKLYYRGVGPDGDRQVNDHQSKMRVPEFTLCPRSKE